MSRFTENSGARLYRAHAENCYLSKTDTYKCHLVLFQRNYTIRISQCQQVLVKY